MFGDITAALAPDAFHGPYIREVANGGWFVMDAALTFTFGFWLWRIVINKPYFEWRHLLRLREYPFEVQFVSTMFLVHFGSAIRAGYIWLLLEAENDGRSTIPTLVELANVMILAGVISMIGGLCMMRIFGWKKLWWMTGVIAILLPVVMRVWL